MVKNLPAMRKPGVDPWVGKIPWRRAWQPTPVVSPGKAPWTKEPRGLQSMGSQRVGLIFFKRRLTSSFSLSCISSAGGSLG